MTIQGHVFVDPTEKHEGYAQGVLFDGNVSMNMSINQDAEKDEIASQEMNESKDESHRMT
eukprot:CAMPEP_0202968748 /NCGR_PEP_ID=MMETSP1396-20130829/14175_1 /ASSEMBLY_ACC=CAM_ASM_000872 /TAXON_ID= /ORGANISM="Pseudokeronopsis sp., Strain Brazil" /LENGTH=59 /DNA_ID=CAMNT_0049695421 /DNA_START=292 /DNA_END=467 /DNA_ORIENTATION=-